MKLTTELDIKAQIRAVLREDGTLELRATASAVYDEASGASARTVLAVPDVHRETVRVALEAALKAATAAGALPRVLDAVSLTRNHARDIGEVP